MQSWIRPVDVISLTTTEGELKPLRLRLEEHEQYVRINIRDVVNVKEIPYVGVEAKIFTCRAEIYGRDCMIELKYSIPNHNWTLLGKVYG
ncbi:MAG: hypothetical protein J6V25_03080 [Oscillospiraceae bacterium]|nr:hypothetical protein [Oscillospiraceae bacterium]